MATQEVHLPTVWAGGDNHRGGNYAENTRDVWETYRVGNNADKAVADQDSFHCFLSTIPTGSVIEKSKMTSMVSAGPYSEVDFPLLWVGLLEPDGFWDHYSVSPVGHKSSQANLHFVSQVRKPDDSLIFSTSLAAWGLDVIFRDMTEFGASGKYCGSFGMKFQAPLNHTLGSVIARIYRDEGTRPTTTLYCKMYVAVGGARPVPGVLLATSQGVAFDDLPTVLPDGPPPVDWPEWEFTGDDQIPLTSGWNYIYTIEVDGPFGGDPKVYWRFDDDRSDVPPEEKGNLPYANTYSIWNEESIRAFGFGHYASDDLMPDRAKGNLFASTTMTGTFKPATGKDLDDGDLNTWGDVLYGCDATIDLKSRLQTFIDDARYDEDGTMLGLFVETANKTVGLDVFYRAQHWYANHDGMVLTIAYTEPVPGQATNPDPPDLSTGVRPDKILSWTAGTYAGTGAVTHDVFFGTDPDPSGNFIGNQVGTTYNPPGDLLPETTYYWRIDEVGEFETTVGEVWEFTTAGALEGLKVPPWGRERSLQGDSRRTLPDQRDEPEVPSSTRTRTPEATERGALIAGPDSFQVPEHARAGAPEAGNPRGVAPGARPATQVPASPRGKAPADGEDAEVPEQEDLQDHDS